MIEEAVVLSSHAGSDPGVALAPIAGVPSIKRAVIVLARAGIRRIVVVAESDVGARLAADPELTLEGTTIVHVAGTFIEAAPLLDGSWVVVAAADTVYDVALVRAARTANLADADLAFCIDRSPGRDGRAVALADDRIVALDGHHDALATGMYAATPALFAAGSNLASAITAAVKSHRATSVVVGDALWHDASTADARERAEDALFRSLGKRTDGPVSRRINRPISTFVTRRLVATNVTPNQMTLVANVIGAVGVLLVFQGTWATLALGALLVQLQSILDGCDGEIARLKFKSSPLGEWLDNVLDDQVNVAYGVALGFAAAGMTGDAWWRWVGIGAGIAFTLHNLAFYAQLAFVHRSGNPFNFRWWFEKPGVDVTAMLSKATWVTTLGASLRALIRRDVFLFAFLGLAIVGLPQVAALWFAAIAASQFALMVVHLANGGAPKPASR